MPTTIHLSQIDENNLLREYLLEVTGRIDDVYLVIKAQNQILACIGTVTKPDIVRETEEVRIGVGTETPLSVRKMPGYSSRK